jgi:hypothetical protein
MLHTLSLQSKNSSSDLQKLSPVHIISSKSWDHLVFGRENQWKSPDLGVILISGYARFSDIMEHKGDLMAIDRANEWIFHDYASLAISLATSKLVEGRKCTHDMAPPWISFETCHCCAK